VKPGDPVVLPIPAGATGIHVARPDGSSVDLVPGTASGLSATYSQTDQLGVYTATPILPPSPSAGSSGSIAAGPSSSTSSGASAIAPPLGVGADPDASVRFAVDLFDVDESAITPGPNRVLEDLGRAAASPGASGAGSAGNDAIPARPAARDELWIPIVLIVLVGLCVESTLYHRDAVLRTWRGIIGRLRRSPGNQP
jgi:hypothetical protein